MMEGGENRTEESPISDLLGVSGRKLIVSQLIPGTWMLPGVLHVACRALRDFLIGDLATNPVVPGTFSFPLADKFDPPLDACLFPVK